MGGYTHVGHLWSSTGTLLATATFTGETASGWQQVSFSTPVAIAANTVYIVSFSTGGGYFGITNGYFSRRGWTTARCTRRPTASSGGDGVYQTGNGAFPEHQRERDELLGRRRLLADRVFLGGDVPLGVDVGRSHPRDLAGRHLVVDRRYPGGRGAA